MQTFTPLEYIKISAANAYGLDKLTWDARLAWFKANSTKMRGLKKLSALMDSAKEPLLLAKANRAYQKAMQGIPTGYIMGLDATASGCQIMACLTNCITTAKNTNVLLTETRKDLYQTIADTMGYNRDIVKKPVMTYMYGAVAQPKAVFGEELPKFLQALDKCVPGAVNCMADMQSCWDSKALAYTWTLPDGHTAYVPVVVTKDIKVETEELGGEFTYRLHSNEPSKTGLSLAANIVHSVDAYVVRQMLTLAARQGFDLLTIHDSYWASPLYMNRVRENYNLILANIWESDLLSSILKQVTNNPKLKYIKPFRGMKSLTNSVLVANYALS